MAAGDMEQKDRFKGYVLYGAGFNGLNQLSPESQNCSITTTASSAGTDPVAIEILPTSKSAYPIEILFSSWSSTHLVTNNGSGNTQPRIQHLGTGFLSSGEWQAAPALGFYCGFGDHEGLIGCLDSMGRLFIVPNNDEPSGLRRRHGTLVCQSNEKSPLFSHIAQAGNGRVAVTFRQAPNAGLTHVVEFDGLTGLLEFYQDPTSEKNYPARHWMVGGKAKQLLSNVASFALLTEKGEVWTWGDPRHQSLGRTIISGSDGDMSTTAEAPGLVSNLNGVKIVKLAMGGWMTAAISEERSAYVWGSGMPGTDQSIRFKTCGTGDTTMIELPGEEVDGPFDILDVGVGEGHIVVLVEGGKAFGAGNNKNCQLGLQGTRKFYSDWVQIPLLQNLEQVRCGPMVTFFTQALS